MEMKLKQGFTMMEIMIVVVIIGILLAVIAPRIINMMKKGPQAHDSLTFQSIKEKVIELKANNEVQDTDTLSAIGGTPDKLDAAGNVTAAGAGGSKFDINKEQYKFDKNAGAVELGAKTVRDIITAKSLKDAIGPDKFKTTYED
jgi:prepilin-type N-terminal cleavage/methylation domain-containing protein